MITIVIYSVEVGAETWRWQSLVYDAKGLMVMCALFEFTKRDALEGARTFVVNQYGSRVAVNVTGRGAEA